MAASSLSFAPTTTKSPLEATVAPKWSSAAPSDATSFATWEKSSEAAAPTARTRSAASARWRPMVRWWCVMGCEAQAVVVVRGAAAEGLRRRAAGAGDDVVVGWGGGRGAAVRDVHGWWCGARRGRRGAGERRRPGGARRAGGCERAGRRQEALVSFLEDDVGKIRLVHFCASAAVYLQEIFKSPIAVAT